MNLNENIDLSFNENEIIKDVSANIYIHQTDTLENEQTIECIFPNGFSWFKATVLKKYGNVDHDKNIFEMSVNK